MNPPRQTDVSQDILDLVDQDDSDLLHFDEQGLVSDGAAPSDSGASEMGVGDLIRAASQMRRMLQPPPVDSEPVPRRSGRAGRMLSRRPTGPRGPVHPHHPAEDEE